jgi:hypothetical protein
VAAKPPESRQRNAQAWMELQSEIGSALAEDPASERAQDLVARLMELVEETTGGDSEVKAGVTKAWLDRQNWSAWQSHGVSRREEIAEFVRQARIASKRKYYNDEAWAKVIAKPAELSRRHAAAWADLQAEIRLALDREPESEIAQELATRWMALIDDLAGGDAEVSAGSAKAWLDRQNWPHWERSTGDFSLLEANAEFIGKALDWPLRRYFSEGAWAKRFGLWADASPEQYIHALQSRADLFHDIISCSSEDPASDQAQKLAARWRLLREAESGGDHDVAEGAAKAWADRTNWPPALRRKEASSYSLTVEQFDRAADFIDRAIARPA